MRGSRGAAGGGRGEDLRDGGSGSAAAAATASRVGRLGGRARRPPWAARELLLDERRDHSLHRLLRLRQLPQTRHLHRAQGDGARSGLESVSVDLIPLVSFLQQRAHQLHLGLLLRLPPGGGADRRLSPPPLAPARLRHVNVSARAGGRGRLRGRLRRKLRGNPRRRLCGRRGSRCCGSSNSD